MAIPEAAIVKCRSAVTNSRTSPPVSEDRGVGIDTIRIRGPISEIPDADLFHIIKTVRGSEGQRVLSSMSDEVGNGTKLYVNRYGGRLGATFELSVPKAIRHSNLYAASVAETREVVAAIYEEAGSYVHWSVPVEQLGVTRLDTDRDFVGVEDIPGILASLRRVPLSHNRKYGEWGANHRGAETLTVRPAKTSDWKATLYDKGRELHAEANKGDPCRREMLLEESEVARDRLRFELTLRRRVLRRIGVDCLGELNEEGIAEMNRSYFVQAGFHRAVEGPGIIKQAIGVAATEGEGKALYRAIPLLVYQALDERPPISENTERSHKATLRRYGLTAANIGSRDRSPVRLDHANGVLVATSPLQDKKMSVKPARE